MQKEKEVPKKEELPKEWGEILSECVVRLDVLDRQVAKLYKRQQGKGILVQDSPKEDNVDFQNDSVIIFKDGRYVTKANK